jgi:anti-anti-sigma factor
VTHAEERRAAPRRTTGQTYTNGRSKTAALSPPWSSPRSARRPSPLSIALDLDGSTAVLRLKGELDLATAEQLRGSIRTVLKEHDPHRLLLDMTDLSFADSSGLAVMVWAHKQLAARDRQLRLHHPQRNVRRILSITGLDTRLHITDP